MRCLVTHTVWLFPFGYHHVYVYTFTLRFWFCFYLRLLLRCRLRLVTAFATAFRLVLRYIHTPAFVYRYAHTHTTHTRCYAFTRAFAAFTTLRLHLLVTRYVTCLVTLPPHTAAYATRLHAVRFLPVLTFTGLRLPAGSATRPFFLRLWFVTVHAVPRYRMPAVTYRLVTFGSFYRLDSDPFIWLRCYTTFTRFGSTPRLRFTFAVRYAVYAHRFAACRLVIYGYYADCYPVRYTHVYVRFYAVVLYALQVVFVAAFCGYARALRYTTHTLVLRGYLPV